MRSKIRTLIVMAGCLAVATLAGCGRSADEEPVSLLASEATLLRYVPADSPYVLANVEPFPDALLDRLEPKLAPVLEAYQGLLRQTVGQAMGEVMGDVTGGAAEDGADTGELERATAVVDELSSLMTLEGLREAGIDRDSTLVIYGYGLLPVLRIALSDAAMFAAELERIEEQAGEAMQQQRLGEQVLRFVEFEQFRLLLALIDEQLVITIAPTGFDDGQLGRLLGLTLPAENIAGAGTLADLAGRYGYTSHMVGFVDMTALVETFIGEPRGLDAELFAATGADGLRGQLSDVCQAEIRGLAGIAPRLATGYTDVSADVLETHAIVEVRSDLATGLATLAAAVPGLGNDPGGLVSFGMSLDVRAARDFYEARLDALEADPYRCEHLAPLAMSVASGRQVLQQPVPPMVYDFRGIRAVLTRIEGMDFANNQPPTRVDGRLLLAMDNAPALLGLGQMLSPELAALSVEPDGRPVPLELPQLGGVAEDVLVAMTPESLAVSTGPDGAAGLAEMLAADAGPEGTVMALGMDAGRYYSFLGQAAVAAEAGDAGAGDELPPEVQETVARVMTAFSELYDRMWMTARLTDRGVEMNSRITIKE